MEPSDSQQTQRVSEVSRLLRAWSDGDETAFEQLTPIVYKELHRIAHLQMRKERAERTLQTTALVNEAYLRLVDAQQVPWQDRAHFFAISAQIMRRILIDNARRHNLKRGAGFQHVPLVQADLQAVPGDPDLIALDEALNALQQFDARKAKVVELRFFGGLSVEETAAVLKVSTITVIRDWNNAKAWLYRAASSSFSLLPLISMACCGQLSRRRRN
jgi:RNA polymerase sigma-70 factor, ECF subfamily